MNTKSDTFKLLAAIAGGILMAFAIVLLLSKPNSRNPNQTATINPPGVTDSFQPTNNKTSDRISQDSVINQASIETHSKSTTSNDKLQNIAELSETSSDENFNTILKITITNSYGKPLSNVQLYISQDGNSYIPNDLSENSSQLMNVDLSELPPGKQKRISITSNDKGNKNFIYAINTRKIRFSDGVTLTK